MLPPGNQSPQRAQSATVPADVIKRAGPAPHGETVAEPGWPDSELKQDPVLPTEDTVAFVRDASYLG